MRRIVSLGLACLVAGGVAFVVTPVFTKRVEPAVARPSPRSSFRTASGLVVERNQPRPSPRPQPTVPSGPLALAGCPPPARPPGPPGPGPWHPDVLVPNSALPEPQPIRPWRSNLRAIEGKGMWVWQWDQTDGGNADAVVKKAVQAGLRQLWVRVGSSKDGFYGVPVLDALVGPAHQAGVAVIGWGFPYLYDPMRDARWTARALGWRGPGGDRLDGFSADIEKPTEGVALSTRRVGVYLAAVRHAAGDRLVVATVYRPTDLNWIHSTYPYRTMARYVDAFAPMVYWGCNDPREAAAQAVDRLSRFRPVHVIGQAYNMAPEGGRTKAPSPQEITAFLAVGSQQGALGASFWDWQEISPGEWRALREFGWA